MKGRSDEECGQQSNSFHKAVSRRRFLRVMGVVAVGMLAAGCRPERLIETPESTSKLRAYRQARTYFHHRTDCPI